jgi:LuxR family maltose regulon positive regulatory protein
MQALAYEAQSNTPSALKSLERALTLAEPEGYVRIFVDEGIPIAQLLSKIASRGIMTGYIGKLLAIITEETRERANKSDFPTIQPLIEPAVRPAGEMLVEPLSQRELEVLQLVAQGFSNREISDRLFLALPTVKGYNRTIFGKLQVHRRTEAVARARELDLL